VSMGVSFLTSSVMLFKNLLFCVPFNMSEHIFTYSWKMYIESLFSLFS